MTEPVFIIGGHADTIGIIRGTRILECERCSAPTRFSPSSLNRPEAKTATFICLECAEKLAAKSKTFTVEPVTAEQLRELRAALEVE